MLCFNAGESIFISWTVENTGSGVTATDQWFDRVYWSNDGQFGKQVYLYVSHSHYTASCLLTALAALVVSLFSSVSNAGIISHCQQVVSVLVQCWLLSEFIYEGSS